MCYQRTCASCFLKSKVAVKFCKSLALTALPYVLFVSTIILFFALIFNVQIHLFVLHKYKMKLSQWNEETMKNIYLIVEFKGIKYFVCACNVTNSGRLLVVAAWVSSALSQTGPHIQALTPHAVALLWSSQSSIGV